MSLACAARLANAIIEIANPILDAAYMVLAM
jgi:hypothetical protein